MAKQSRSGSLDSFKWVKWIPLKINCFVWRLLQNRILTSANLIGRGISVSSTLCPFCCNVEDDTEHVFFSCPSFTSVI